MIMTKKQMITKPGSMIMTKKQMITKPGSMIMINQQIMTYHAPYRNTITKCSLCLYLKGCELESLFDLVNVGLLFSGLFVTFNVEFDSLIAVMLLIETC
jgi:hypothetical protein